MTSAIISTTINTGGPAYNVYRMYAEQGELIVAGDDHPFAAETEAMVVSAGGTFISFAEQERRWPTLSKIVGRRTIQRRNFALLWALEESRDWDAIFTVDDDNIPSPQFVSDHLAFLRGDAEIELALENVGSREISDWVNIGYASEPVVWQRGTPYGVGDYTAEVARRDTAKIGVSQSVILGDPDVDAVSRIALSPEVRSVRDEYVVVPDTSDFVFNSQATAWRTELAPLMAVLPGVGRYDDIFGSIVAVAVMSVWDYAVHVGSPSVFQERNDHNLAKDLEAELFGMRWTLAITSAVEQWDRQRSMREVYNSCIQRLDKILPDQTIGFMREWSRLWAEREKTL